MALPKIRELIDSVGEEQARAIYLKYYRDPEHLEEFAELFSNYVPDKLAGFHGELFDYFEDDRNCGIAAPRGFSKSTVTDTIYLAHRLLFVRSHFALLISDTFTQASTLLDSLKTELESNEILQWMFGNVRGQIWSAEGMIVRGVREDGKFEWVKVLPMGAGMKVRGLRFKQYRPDLVIIDDLENDELVESAERREKLHNWFIKSLMPALRKESNKIIYIGTILHREALLAKVIERRAQFSGWITHRYQAITNGKSLWPERFTLDWLIGMRDDPNHEMYVGPVSFSQEMQNQPISADDQIIQPEWTLSRFSLAPTIAQWHSNKQVNKKKDPLEDWLDRHFKGVVGHIDPAISEKQTADWWAFVTVGITRHCPICDGGENHVVALDYFRMREKDPTKQVDKIIEGYQKWNHAKIRVETVAYQSGLYQLAVREAAKRNIRMPLFSWKPDKDKVRRAIMQSANFAGGLVHLREDHPLFSVFLDEVIQFPQGEHDDMFDAFLGASEDTVMRSKVRTFKSKPKGF